MRTALRVPSGAKRGSRKHDSPPSACASTRKASDIGAEKNHLCPVSSWRPALSEPTGVARVVFARTSEPPCFSVIPIPIVLPALSQPGTDLGSYIGARMRGSQSVASSGASSRDGTHAYVIVSGQLVP